MAPISPQDPFPVWAVCCPPPPQARMWSSARGALASRVMGSFWPDPKTRAQIRSRGGYSLVLNGVAVGFSASAQCLAVVSAGLCSAVKIWSMARERDCSAFTAAVLS